MTDSIGWCVHGDVSIGNKVATELNNLMFSMFNMCVCMCMHSCVYMCVCMHVCVCVYVCTLLRVPLHTHTQPTHL